MSGTEYYLSTSIGIALYPGHSNDATMLLCCADTTMYNVR